MSLENTIRPFQESEEGIPTFVPIPMTVTPENVQLTIESTGMAKKRTRKTKVEPPSCQICAETYNRSYRRKIVCEYCPLEACLECCKRYLLQENEPKCMSNECNRQWTPEFVSKHLSKKFVNEDLKLHCEKVLFDKQRALMPATQPLVEHILKREEFQREINAAAEVVHQARIKMHKIQSDYYRFANSAPGTKERTAFIRACPSSECRGFLSSQWKCGLCNLWSCPTCHEIKGLDRECEHTCNPDSVATANLLNSDTKPCPKCGEGIFKIDGCFAADTPILLWDGSTKMSQNIQIGDVLVGDDGKQRTVLRLMTGEDELYEVQQNKAINYTVNSKHTLLLKYSGNKSIYWNDKSKCWILKWFDKDEKKPKSKQFKITEKYNKEETKKIVDEFKNDLYEDDTIELVVDDYLKLEKSIKRNLVGYRNKGINYHSQQVNLDPYILGLWIGDGTHSHPVIASNDKEIVDYMIGWCNKNNSELVKEGKYKYRFRRKGYSYGCECLNTNETSIISEESFPKIKDRTNPFTDLLKKYNLIKNKHIPQEYLMNDRSVRLQLLAGIIDTDGCVSKEQKGKRVTIIQTNVNLSEQIIFLARSLGFNVNYQIRERKNCVIFNCEAKDYKDQYVINISGEKLYEIPTILPRKKCIGSTPNRNHNYTSINVKNVGKGTYYGWEVDCNNRFILKDFTSLQNCSQMWCTQCHTAFCWRTGRIETTVHNPHYYEWMRRNGTLARNPADVVCGNELNHTVATTINGLITMKMLGDKPNSANIKLLGKNVGEKCRRVVHFRYVSVPHYQYNGEGVIQELRIQYMRQHISEERFKMLLQKEHKKSNKYREILEVVQLLIATITDIIHRFILELNDAEWTYNLDRMNEIDEIIAYGDECFLKISRTYSSTPLTFYKL